MIGKGWLVIYVFLLFICLYLALAQHKQAAALNEVRAQLQELKAGSPSTEPAPSASDASSPAPSENASTAASRDEQRKDDMRNILTALQAYGKEKKQYPTDLNQLIPKNLEALPKDPLDPKYTYRYRRDTQTSFTLTAVWEEKNDATDKGDGKADGFYVLTQKSKP